MDALFKKSKAKVFEKRIKFMEVSDPQMCSKRSEIQCQQEGSRFGYEIKSADGKDNNNNNHDDQQLSLWWDKMYPIGLGLDNMGNTCYLNSILQCLIHTPAFANYLMKRSDSCRISGFCCFCAFKRLVDQSLKSGHRKASTSPGVIVKHLKVISKFLKPGRQEDSHEFLRGLIDALSTSFKKGHYGGGSGSSNPIKSIFGFTVESKVKCLHCKHESIVNDPALDISVDIKDCGSIESALASFSKADRLVGRNRYMCEKCKCLRDAVKMMSISTAPNVLSIHLKRFGFNAFGPEKINRLIKYPETLRVKVGGSQTRKYLLYAVNVHSGNSSRSGHYYSYVKSPSGVWYCMDDSNVVTSNVKDVLEQRAYILFYAMEQLYGSSSIDTPRAHDARQTTTATSTYVPPTPPESPVRHVVPSAPVSIEDVQKKPVINKPTTVSIESIFANVGKKKTPKVEDSLEKEETGVVEPKELFRSKADVLDLIEKSVVSYANGDMNGKNDDNNNNNNNNNEPSVSQLTTPPRVSSLPKQVHASNTNREQIMIHKNDESMRPVNLECEVKAQNIVPAGHTPFKRPSQYDLEYDRGKSKKRKQRKSWTVFDLQANNNPFTSIQNKNNSYK